MKNEDDWTPQLEPPEGREYKWGLDGETGQLTIWEVCGPGDGLPTHTDQLTEAWGRPDHFRTGDILGTTFITNDTVHVVVYGAHRLQARPPDQLLAWLDSNYPRLPVTHHGADQSGGG